MPPACLLKDRRAPTSLDGSTKTLPDPLGVSQGVVPIGNDDSGRTFPLPGQAFARFAPNAEVDASLDAPIANAGDCN